MTEESAVKVCVRVRPLIAREESAASENAESVQLFWKTDKKSIHQIDDGNSTKTFSFDRVFTAEETTNQLYQDIAKPLVVSTVEGYNGTIFAYGQTSSGKTFTMMGSDHIPGVIPLAVEDVFQTIKNCPKKEFLLRVSYMEIYNETVTDLLVDSWKRKPLEVRETINKNIYVADLTEELVISPAQALAWIRKGEKNRHYGKTKMNQRSSRSHTIFRMILESRERSDVASGENADGAIIVSHLNLVDLAGSERASQTGAEGTRFKEGCNINRSLFTLGQVIKKVTEESQKGFTNYRDSKLTRILQNSLGGNAKTVIICTITPVTLDETLSTLQFASTAKKMKNDPHVTEVSDDGALLKRYRNEIVDLKRRLHEVSSVTQTTVTEKEVLSQLLQEKDSLQREQEDRIKNLTKLLVTSTNQVPVKKMPKRRVTWGGKMLRLATSSACGDSSNLSFAESFTRKRKADRSCLMELTEDDEEFEANWEIPDEPSDDMEISQSSVTVRSFGDSPKDYTSPDWMRDFSGKEEAMTKVESLEGRVAELELQLQTEAQQKQEALEKVDTSEKRAAEMEQQQQSEAQQKLEAKEKVLMLELRVADLERQLEEQRHGLTENEQIRREFADTIQLCETLASEKDMVVAERDYLKQELGMFIEQTERLEKEKAALSQELEEKRETDEFKSLEEEFKKEQELEVQNEISSYKKVIESTEVKCQELQNKVDTLSEEILKKTKSAEQLQRMSGEELVQEVAKLRRSLDDAEGVSRDTKKEWAVLRSQNITLEEIKVILTSNLEKMEAEVNSLCSQLEIEKSRYRKMESDLQKELTVTFDENTKLTNLLDGKVPKNLIDCVEFERTVATLSEELTASREAEGALRVQLEELASSQTPHKVDNLMKQVCELSEELSAVQSQRESLLSAQAQYQEEAQQLQGLLQISHDERVKIQADLSAAALREQELILHCTDVSQQLNSLHSDRERSDPEIQFEEICLKLEESDQQRALLVEKVNEMQQLIKHLEKKLADSEVSRTSQEEISKELQEQLKQQTQVLQCVQADKEALLSEQKAETPNSAEEMDQLLSTLTSVTAERDQLKMDLQENVEMMIENQEELRTALEKNREQKELLSHLETLQKSEVDGALTEKSAQLEARQKQIKTLTEQVENARAGREALLFERKTSFPSSSNITLHSSFSLSSVCEERDQLQETLQKLRQEKQQLGAELGDKLELEESDQQRALLVEKVNEMQQLIKHLEKKLADSEVSRTSQEEISKELQEQLKQQTQVLQCVQADKEALLSEQKAETPNSAEEMDQLLSTLTSVTAERDQLKMDLQENVEMMIENQEELRTALEKNREQKELLSHLETLQKSEVDGALTEKSAQLEARQKQIKTLTEQVENAGAGREALLFERKTSFPSSSDITLHSSFSLSSVCEERDQLQETLQKLRQEIQQLGAELGDKLELEESDQQRALLVEKVNEMQQLIKHLEKKLADSEVSRTSQEEISKELQEQLKQQTQVLQCVQAEKEALLSEQKAETPNSAEEMDQLLSTLTSVTAERDQLKTDLQENVEMMIENQEELRTALEKNREQKELLSHLETLQKSEVDGALIEMSAQLEAQQKQIKSLTEQVENSETSFPSSSEENAKLLCRVTSLCEERDQLQETLQELRQENQQLRAELEDRMETLQCEVKTLTEKLESTETERDSQLCYKEASFQSSSEEKEKLLCRVTSLSEERDQLQETLQELRQENQQLKAELEDRMENLQCEVKTLTEKLESTETERDSLLCDKEASFQSSSEEKEKLLCRVTSLSEERDQLQETLQELRQENQQLRAELEDRMKNLQCEVKTLTEKLESTETERDSLLCDKEASFQSSSEEKEKLLCRVTSLSEERDQLQETLQELRQENQQLKAELEDRMENLQCEVKTLTEKLESTETERDSLLCDKEASFQSSSEEKEKLLCRVTSLSEERDQLQETLQELRQENQQLRAELEDRMKNLQCEVKTLTEKLESTETERDSLLCYKEASFQSSSEEKEKLLCRVTSLSEERDQLQETLQEVRQENQQLKAELEDRMENLQCEVKTLTEKLESTETERDSLLCDKEASYQSSSEEKEKLLCRVTSLCEEKDKLQETLQELRQENQQLKAELEDRMENLQCEVNTLTEKLESTETERDSLLCYKEASFQSSSEEKEKLLCRVTSLCEERDQLQETLQELRQENQQLKAELEDRMENLQCEVKTLTEKLESTETERDSLLSHKEASFQSSSEEKEKLLCRVMSLCEERDQLQETLQELRKENQQLRAELEDRMENLQCELLRADRGSTGVEVTVSSRLNDSTRQLQETFRGFEHFIDKCSKYISIPMDKVLRVQSGLNHGYLTSLPKSTMSAYTAICQLGLDTVQTLGNIVVCLQVKAQDFRNRFEELVKKDLSVFEERRLQDVLLCRVQAPSFSVKDEDFHTVWEHRLTELLDKRELYQQKMSIILEKFLDNVASHPNELSAEITLRERFKEQLQGTISTQPISFGELDSILSCELDRRAALAHSKKMILQDITAEQSVLSEELKLLEAQACFQLREEKSKSSTLLQAIEGAPLKTELSLLKDNQNLLIQLKHTEEKVKALHVQNEQLEEAQIQAKDMLSSHKQATQLLQTELQDSRAQHDEKEMTIKTLRGKLQECEKRASPSAVELENLQTKLFKMEVELSSASDKHQQEIQKMSTVLAVKEESLRNLKETLRRLQQQGEESFLQGEDLHTKLTNTRGLVIKSSILLDKAKLEEEVKQLYLKITELECLVSTQQTEISKWKSRAISLKVKSKVEVDKPSSPCTTAKRGPQETADSSFLSSPKKFVVTSRKILDSPRKVMDFPKVYQLHSPKSRLFDVGGSSDLLSRTYPKQFFDNSSLGTIPDAAAGVDAARKDEWWPQSPKQEDMCKTQ